MMTPANAFGQRRICPHGLIIRRSQVQVLPAPPDDYPPHLRALAEEARRIALGHPDEIIRERAEITYLPRPDTKVQFSALPHRERETDGGNEPQGESDPS